MNKIKGIEKTEKKVKKSLDDDYFIDDKKHAVKKTSKNTKNKGSLKL